MNKILVKIENGNLKILINNILHLQLKTEEFLGIQSYVKEKIYYIEFYFSNTMIEVDYNNEKLWVGILKQLNKIKI